MSHVAQMSRLSLAALPPPGTEAILDAGALAFLTELCERFEGQRQALLERRRLRQQQIDDGKLPDFLPETAEIRAGDWTVAPIPAPLLDRRVEITGPVDRKMVINALNSGARMFMADFEDSTSPTWRNLLEGQVNLFDAVRGRIEYTSPEGKHYRLAERTATLLVRPRGWHLPEAHLLWDGKPMSGALFDFGLFVYHNAKAQIEAGLGPYFYLPKLESHLEARLWNQVLDYTEDRLGLPRGTIKVTVLIETLFAAFEMDEILWELREHIVGLNCGRWDYIFSYIRTFQADPTRVLPDRAQVTMASGFLRAYSQLLIRTCHRRGAFAMGGMAAQIPIRGDEDANAAALAKVRADKEREASDGHDGTWVAHPGLVPVAMEVFDRHMPGPNQLERLREDVRVGAAELIAGPGGRITEPGLRGNIRVGIQYLAAWLGGSGCVPIDHLMEDAATAEIARAQLWQWTHHGGARLDDGRRIGADWVESLIFEELDRLLRKPGPLGLPPADLEEAGRLIAELTRAEHFETFLTIPAYDRLLSRE